MINTKNNTAYFWYNDYNALLNIFIYITIQASMCSSDTLPDNFQVGSCVLYVITDTMFFFDQSCKAHVTPVCDQ